MSVDVNTNNTALNDPNDVFLAIEIYTVVTVIVTVTYLSGNFSNGFRIISGIEDSSKSFL